jgi:hypothetical protein
METWEVVIICLLAMFVGIAILILTDVNERIRRKQHPKWYELYDRAKNNAFDIGGKYTQRLDNINMRRKFYQDLYIEGKCTDEEYKKAMNAIDVDFIDAYKWYKQAEEALRINEDLKEADAYAKKHNLKWGIIYE